MGVLEGIVISISVLIVAKCIVNGGTADVLRTLKAVLIVAKCIVNEGNKFKNRKDDTY